MSIQAAADEYVLALRQGKKEYDELLQAGRSPNPAVLDDILPESAYAGTQLMGVLEIPAERIVGTKSAGRISAFTPSFRPLMDVKSEFATKWINLCSAHLDTTGIQDPIVCYEYLGNFYVQEGNKRVSVLRHFGAARIPAEVKRLLPPKSDDPQIKAYYEFLEFYKLTKLYTVQFRNPRDYGKLLAHLGRSMDEKWTEDQRRSFNTGYHYFLDAFNALNTKHADVLPEEALLLWLQMNPFSDLTALSASDLKKSLASIWDDVLSAADHDAIKMQTESKSDAKAGIITRLTLPDFLNVAFIHQMNPATSAWAQGHQQGVDYIANLFGSDRISIHSYFDANSPEETEALLERAVADGAHVVFTTAPLMRAATLKAAVRYPKVHFLNCSVYQPYSSIRTYYGRIYEAKFITGAIAGALAQNDRVGYIASYPILGSVAEINAFALGAQLANPRAQIELRWSCVEGNPLADFLAGGIRVISNRDAPAQSRMFLDFCSYGTYLMDDRGELVPLGSPVWMWGKFYETVLRRIFDGTWKNEKTGHTALNYWLGMDSGVIDIHLSNKLPEGVRTLAGILRSGIVNRTVDPFFRRIVAQDGSVKNDGTQHFTPDQLLHMDWLCANVLGEIPAFDELLPISKPMVQELGLYRDSISNAKEVRPHESTIYSR